MVRIWMIYLISTPLVFLLDQLFFFAEYEGWLVIILSCAIGTIISFFAVKLASYDREEQWGMFGERIVGKWLHKAILFLFVFLLYATSDDDTNCLYRLFRFYLFAWHSQLGCDRWFFALHFACGTQRATDYDLHG